MGIVCCSGMCRFRNQFSSISSISLTRRSRWNYVFIFKIMYTVYLDIFCAFCYLTRGSKNDVTFSITIPSLDPYPRIAGDSHILFQPITAISSLLDLIGPLPQGRRLFGPTVLESRQPSRNLPIFSGRGRTYRREEKRTRKAHLRDLRFPILESKREGGRETQKYKNRV